MRFETYNAPSVFDTAPTRKPTPCESKLETLQMYPAPEVFKRPPPVEYTPDGLPIVFKVDPNLLP